MAASPRSSRYPCGLRPGHAAKPVRGHLSRDITLRQDPTPKGPDAANATFG
ncbi:hypothetical protein HALO32_03494 [Halomonas lysinitropha]|uniref:Uncharacterized protein n=1 Tax=Halomonas lysinitropha TaxID=2607506 RepID=A0A5K1I7X5_9GAMM|nr:hypothetical protein HALO32_03494 [Halomonas lysinitropha]